MAEEAIDAMDSLLTLDRDNQDRRKVERAMLRDILADVSRYEMSHSVVAFEDDFHPGVQGIVASRLVDRTGKPAVVLSQNKQAQYLSGSMRTTVGVHAREVFQTIADNYPQVIVKFGGHAGAAGLTIVKAELETFGKAFNEIVAKQLNNEAPVPVLLCDGELMPQQLHLNQWQQLQQIRPYGRGWEKPLFTGEAMLKQCRVIGSTQTHLSLNVDLHGKILRAVWFNAMDNAGDRAPVLDGQRIRFVYELAENSYNGQTNLQLLVRHAEPV